MPKFENISWNFSEYRPSELFEIVAAGKDGFQRIGSIKKDKDVNNNMLIKENKFKYVARFENAPTNEFQ